MILACSPYTCSCNNLDDVINQWIYLKIAYPKDKIVRNHTIL